MNLEKVETWDLIKELQNRGYNTTLLWNREDVENQLENLNEDREAQGKEDITLTDDEKDEILQELSFDYYMERINGEIFDKLFDYVED